MTVEESMTDICSVCAKCQEYGTMSDINEDSFDLICDDCLDKATKPNEIYNTNNTSGCCLCYSVNR
jgi:hypothetical protein